MSDETFLLGQEINKLKRKGKNINNLNNYNVLTEKSINLFNHKTATSGYYISNGTLLLFDNRATSDFIEIEYNTEYIKNQVTATEVSLFDKDKNFIQQVASIGGVITIPNNPLIKFLRFFVNTSVNAISSIMFIKGSTLPSNFIRFSDITYSLDGLKVTDEFEKEYVPYQVYAKKLNPPKQLFIPTYDGGNQAMHPKVLYFANGWQGYKYWMCFTPYTGTQDGLENPSIAVSNNGIEWNVPKGLINPLNIPDDLLIAYNSDPHLVYNSTTDTLECWFRWATRSTQSPLIERIYRMTTKDGINWTEKELLNEYQGSLTGLQCPVVIYEDNKYKIWYSHSLDSLDPTRNIRRLVKYCESTTGANWIAIRDITLQSDEGGALHVLNHFDVIKKDGVYKMVGTKADSTGIIYMTSADNITYTAPVSVLLTGNATSWDGGYCYRPSITVVNGYEYLYYCGKDTTSNWGTGLIIVDDITNMRTYGGIV